MKPPEAQRPRQDRCTPRHIPHHSPHRHPTTRTLGREAGLPQGRARAAHDGVRQAAALGDGQGVAAPGDAPGQLVPGSQGGGVDLHAGVLEHRVLVLEPRQRLVVGRGEDKGRAALPTARQRLQHSRTQRRALRGIRACWRVWWGANRERRRRLTGWKASSVKEHRTAVASYAWYGLPYNASHTLLLYHQDTMNDKASLSLHAPGYRRRQLTRANLVQKDELPSRARFPNSLDASQVP